MADKDFTVYPDKRTVISPVVRLSYVKLAAPAVKMNTTDQYRYSCRLDLDKSAEGTDEFIKTCKGIMWDIAMEQTGQNQEEAKKLLLMMAANKKIILRDGDSPGEADKGMEGFYFMGCGKDQQYGSPVLLNELAKAYPKTVNEMNHAIFPSAEGELYSGVFAKVRFKFSYYSTGSKGITAYLDVVMKIRDGERLDGGVTATQAESEFGDFAADPATLMPEAGGEGEAFDPMVAGAGQAEAAPAATAGQAAGQADDDFNFM